MIMNYSIKNTNFHYEFHFNPSKEERHLVGDGELVVAGGDWRQVGDRVPAGEGAPWSTWFGHLRQDVVDIDFLRQLLSSEIRCCQFSDQWAPGRLVVVL